MSWPRPHLAAPTRLSCRETQRAIRRALRRGATPTLHEIWRDVSASRMFDAPFILSAAGAAWALAVETKWVYRAIRNGSLPAEKEELADGRFRWQILRSDVERIAQELNGAHEDRGEFAETDEDRVERIRLLEFEGRAGKPR